MEQGGASAGWGARGFELVERLLRFGAAEGGQGDTPTAFRADTQVPVRPSLLQSEEDLATVVQATTVALSPRAVTPLVAHPDAVCAASAVAADALSAKDSDNEPEIIGGADAHLVERPRPLKRLDRITGHLDDAYVAWCRLTVPYDGQDGVAPLALLCQGKAGIVEAATAS